MTNRAISARLRKILFEPFRDKDLRLLLTIDHSTFPEPYRFVSGDPNEFASITSGGKIFTTFPFSVSLLTDDERQPEARISIQNADDRIGSTILELSNESLSVILQVVLREDPDTIEYEVVNLELVDVEITAVSITGKLLIRGLATEPCPGRRLSNLVSPVFFR